MSESSVFGSPSLMASPSRASLAPNAARRNRCADHLRFHSAAVGVQGFHAAPGSTFFKSDGRETSAITAPRRPIGRLPEGGIRQAYALSLRARAKQEVNTQ